MDRRLRVLPALLASAALLAALPRPVLADDARSAIAAAYHHADTAYDRADLDGVFASFTPSSVVVDPSGKQHYLPELRARMKYSWRRPPTARALARRASTTITSIDVDGTHATVRGTVDAELAMIDRAGSAADGHDVTSFEDQWSLTPAGWKIARDRIVASNRTMRGQPSQQMQAATALIRQNTQNMMDFDKSLNYGDCMNSPSMQRFGYNDRQEMCRRR